jgi:LPS-assembly protein
MKNKFLNFIITLLISISVFDYSIAQDEFKFNITEIEISDDGNLIIGSKGGKAETYDGKEITAEKFVYNKSKNILNVFGNIKFLDKNNNLLIFSDKATYFKNDEKIFTIGNSKAVNQNNIITSKNFNLNIEKNILVAIKKIKRLFLQQATQKLSVKITLLPPKILNLIESKTL